MAMGRNEEARNIILKVAKRNGVVLSNDTLNKFEMISMAEGKPVSSTAACLSLWYSLLCMRRMVTNDITVENRAIFIFCGSIKDQDYNPTLFWKNVKFDLPPFENIS
jgi:hypothetical protein